MPDYGKSCLRLFFSLCELLSPAFRRCLTHFARRLFARRLTWLAREVLSRILGVLRVGLQTRKPSLADGRRSVVGCVVTRGRIRGEWTTPCYQLGASRLPRANKLLHPHQRTILVPNQADLSYTGLLFLVPSPSQFVGGAKVKVSWYITV